MFLMLSGALMLDPGKPFQIRTLYRKNILRILTAFLFWSALYALGTYFANRTGAGRWSLLSTADTICGFCL